jgi:ABC-type nitrate/sulfonate/bicarbonate transport system permease component
MNLSQRTRKLWPPLAVFGAIVSGWYALAYSLDNNFASGDGSALIIPPPHQLFVGLNEATVDRIVSATFISAGTALVGLLISIVVGMLFGVVMNMSRALESALWPWLIVLQVTPIIVLTPIIVRVVGPTFGARVLVTVLIAFSRSPATLCSACARSHDPFMTYSPSPDFPDGNGWCNLNCQRQARQSSPGCEFRQALPLSAQWSATFSLPAVHLA